MANNRKMIIIITSIFLVLALLFWSTIQTAVKTIFNSNLDNGYLWFFSLLIINIIVLITLVVYYNYLMTTPGKQGMQGDAGFPGQPGEQCTFPCSTH